MELEREVAIAVTPDEFSEKFVAFMLPAQKARGILANMGIELPVFLASKHAHIELNISARLDRRAIAEFNRQAIAWRSL